MARRSRALEIGSDRLLRSGRPASRRPRRPRVQLLLLHPRAGPHPAHSAGLERAPNGAQEAPDNVDEVLARFISAAPSYGLESADGSAL